MTKPFFSLALLAGLLGSALAPAAQADTRVYVGIGLPLPPAVVVEARRPHYYHPAPVYYREPVVYYGVPARHHHGHGHHRHDHHCRHYDDRHDRRDARYWRGHDDDRGHWRGDDHRRHRGRRD